MQTAPVEIVERFHGALMAGDGATAQACLASDVRWNAAYPIDELTGPDEFRNNYWLPLQRALPDIERRPFIRVAGSYDGKTMDGDGAAGEWVNATGYLVGTFVAALFGIPPTGRTLYLRFSELIRVHEERIVEAYVLLDFWDAMVQAGVSPHRPSLGHAGLVLPPASLDGLHRPPGDSNVSAVSRALVIEMLAGLGRFDGKSLMSMDQERYWHSDFMWYGPGGIGTTRGLEGFRTHHQGPFLRAFPTRGVDRTKSLVADGHYVVAGGWPHMTAEHLGGDWLGLAPTGRRLTMRVMDFWRREGALLKENWVSIDIFDILRQLGLDPFEQMRELRSLALRPAAEGPIA